MADNPGQGRPTGPTPADQAVAIRRALAVMRAWDGGVQDNLPLALHEADRIIATDGDPSRLLEGLIQLSGFLLVNLEQGGQPSVSTFAMLEAFVQALESVPDEDAGPGGS